jgi:deoxyribose-phosphate aldolase
LHYRKLGLRPDSADGFQPVGTSETTRRHALLTSVATAFLTGLVPPDLKLEEVRRASYDGADEVDMVIARGVFLAGDYNRIFDEIAATRKVCGTAP